MAPAPSPSCPAPFPPQAPLTGTFPALPALAALGSRPRWVAYQAVWLPGRGKWTKVPYNPRSDPQQPRKAAINDPATWGTLSQAIAFARATRAAGVGYVFRAPSPTADVDALCGVDLDGCRDPETGELAAWAWNLIRQVDSYTEVSPSGTGVHVLVEGALPSGWRRRDVPGVPGGAIELYDCGRFFTVTGRHVADTPTSIEPRAEALARLHALFVERRPPAPLETTPVTRPAESPDADDEVLLERARRAANGAAFEHLWQGNTSSYGGDDSAADLALCAHLRFWTGGDRARTDRLFRRSGLMRPKWDERRGDRTYGERTLDRAMSAGTNLYSPTSKHETSGRTGQATSVVARTTEGAPLPDAEDFSAFSSNGQHSASSWPSDGELAEAIGATPALAAEACLSEAAVEEGAVARAVWLEPYVEAAHTLSPRTPRTLHEAAGVFALAAATARRAFVPVGGKRLYPAFYLAFVERSTLYSKTGGLDVLRLLLDAAGLSHLLLPASFTPQALVADLALHVPQAVRDGGPDEQARWLGRHRHAAQRAIVRDELAGLFEDCTKEYNAGLLPLLLKLDGAPEQVDPDLTLSRGLVEVRDVGINLIGATTPAAFRLHATKPYHWANGLFGRFALLAAGEPPAYAFWPEHVTSLPAPVVDGLTALYDAFPSPRATFVYADPSEADRPERPERGEQGDGARIVGATQDGYSAVAFGVAPEAWRAWQRYDAALFGLVRDGRTPERLDPTYGRLPTTAIRLALTLAATEWALDGGRSSGPAPLIERRHWARPQEITERWRHHTHAVLAHALREEAADDAATAAARLVRFLAKAGGHQKRGDLQRGLNLTSEALDAAVAAAGPRVWTWEEKTRGQPARWVSLTPVNGRSDIPQGTGGTSPTATTEGTEGLYQVGAGRTSVVRVTTEVPATDAGSASGPAGSATQSGRGPDGVGQHREDVRR